MSEISNCPLCGEVPNTLYYTHQKTHITCCNVTMPHGLWDKYCAAMSMANATRTLEDAMEPLNSGRMKMAEALPAIRLAMEDQKSCEQRVLEVFHA